MKILWVSDHPSLQFVGQSVVARNYLSRFKQLGHEVTAVGFNQPQEGQPSVPVDYNVFSVARSEEGVDKQHLIRILQGEQSDAVVLSHDPFLFEMISEIRPYCKRLVGYYTIDAEPIPDIWAKTLYQCDDIVVPSKYGRKIIKERFPDLNIHVVPYGVDSEMYKPFTPEEKVHVRKTISTELAGYADHYGIDLDNKFVAIFYGHNQGKKNLLASQLAWEQFSKDKDDIIFLLVTHTRYVQIMGWTYPGEFILKDFVNTKNLVVLPVVLPQQGLRNLVGLADVLLAPTIGEGLFLPAMECMAAGTLPLTTFFAAPTDYLTNDNSFPLYKWVPIPGSFSTIRAGVDPNYLAGRLQEAYSIWKANPGKWQQMQQNAISSMKKYNWDESTKQFLDIISAPKVDRTWQLFKI